MLSLGRTIDWATFNWSNWFPFQINRDLNRSTVDSHPGEPISDSISGSPNQPANSPTHSQDFRKRIQRIKAAEVCLIFLFFIGFAGQAVPHVNEAHYLAKAKHFWNSNWCPGDLFLSSSNSHWLFYFCFGWLTQFVSLEAFAWIGRLGTWLALAWAWQRLSWQVVAVPFVAPLTAVLFFLLNSRFHLAGEWVVGGFEAKGIAYAILIFGLTEMFRARWKFVWPLMGLAASMHLLVGCWGIVGAAWVWLVDGRERLAAQDAGRSITGQESVVNIWNELREQWLSLAAMALLITFGAIPPLLADWGESAETTLAASQIYVNERLSHHLIFNGFSVSQVAKFTMLMVVWFVMHRWCRQNWKKFQQTFARPFHFGLASLLISLGGLVLSGIASENEFGSEMATRLLKLYWFRMADFAIPATLSLMIGWIIAQWWNQTREKARKISAGLASALILLAGVLQIFESHADPRPVADQRSLPDSLVAPEKNEQKFQKWKQVCEWIKHNTDPDARFITPSQQQTFKWYAQRTEVVCWKDVPQDSKALLEWSQRVDELVLPQQQYELGLMSFSDDQLRELGKKYQARYLLVPQMQVDAAQETELKRVYPEHAQTNSAYVVFEL